MSGRTVGTRTASTAGKRRWLRDRPIRTKLALVLTLPVLTVVALTGLSVQSAARRAADAGEARELVALGGTGARLVAQLQRERAAAALVFAASSSAGALNEFKRQASASDAIVLGFREELARTRLPGSLQSLMARVGEDLAGLPGLREKVTAAPDAVLSVVAFRYRAMIADVLSYRQALGQIGVSSSTANGLRSTAALSQAIESLSLLQVAAVRALAAGRLTPAGQEEIVAADTAATEALQTFSDLGRPGWMAQLNARIGGGPQVLLAERLQGLVTRAQPGAALDLGTDAGGWSAAVGARIDVMHAVETGFDSDLLGAVTAERDAQRRTIYASSGAVALLLVIAIVLGLVMARSLTGSLTRLQAGAREVATSRLPRLVHDLNVDNADPAAVERLVAVAAEPIPAQGGDEVAGVARAFNEVAAAAVRIAGEQAALRAKVGAILVSLSRRLQLRTDAMMVSLDGLEKKEEDPERLGKLFDLDHTATLIRRLIFNLHELAGGRAGRLRDRPVALTDLLRAATQEIERYTRVETGEVDEAVEVSGEVSDELIHLLAELLDNATWATPRDAPVLMTARHVGDRLHVQIRDSGTGMSEVQLQAARTRVANPHRLDFDTAQHMGLAVVGAIAQRLGIRIEFRSQLHHGTAVDLTVPDRWFSRRQEPMHEPTAELTPISASVRAAPPPTWPPLPDATPTRVEPPVIYNELAQDPSRSWFHQPATDEPEPRTAELVNTGVGADWRTAARAAKAAESALPTETTANGLPVRVPNQRLVPPASPATIPAAPVARQPERIRRQMAGFQHGLSAAGRRQASRQAKDTLR